MNSSQTSYPCWGRVKLCIPLWLYWFFVAAQAFSSCREQGLLFPVVRGLLTVAASLVVDHRLQVVKPHTPLIRFPDRRDNPKPNVSEVLRSAGLPSHTSSISQHSKGSKSPDWLMHQGPPDTAEMIKTLPQKYRRKLVSQEEIEFIQRGGPE